jgi:heterodisulfide reductase subunit C2
MKTASGHQFRPHISATIEAIAHTQAAVCYQCGKCTAGCPVAARMDRAPNQLVRLLQLGDAETALRTESLWECVSCLTCSARCPKHVDCAALLDALRETALQRGVVAPSCRPLVEFQKAFLDNVRRNGRLYELELIARFKTEVFLGTRRLAFLFKDASLAPKLMKREKLHLFPRKARDRKVIERIFARCS